MHSLRILFISILLCIAVPGVFAASTAVLTVPEEGYYQYWFKYKDINNKETYTIPQTISNKKATIDLPLLKDKVAESKLYVLNANKNIEAIYPIKANTPVANIDLKDADFRYLRKLSVVIVSLDNNNPIAAGIITLQSNNYKAAKIINASLPTIEFEDVPTGDAKVTVYYGDNKSTTQDINISPSLIANIKIPIIEKVETINDLNPSLNKVSPDVNKDNEANDGKNNSTTPVNTKSPIDYGNALLGIILFGALIYVVYRLMKNKGATIKSVLKQAGIDVPEDKPEDSSSKPELQKQVIDPSICPFCGGKKDLATGACTCTVKWSPSSGSTQDGVPQLVVTFGANVGTIYPISSDVITIGRDESNTVALISDTTSSRKHAKITNANGEFTISDEGSSNGTFVNGIKITNTQLNSGDEIQIGNTRFRFDA